MNAKEEVVIPHQYSEAYVFVKGMAQVKNNEGKWGFVNEAGEEVIPCQYEDVGSFTENGLRK